MGLLDQLAGQALGAVMGGGQQGGNHDMLSAVLGMVQGHEGGLGGLVANLAKSGLADQVASWVGTGANLPVEGGQLSSALGGNVVGELAAKLGLSPEAAGGALAQYLPMIIDKLTPNGQVEAHGDLLQQGMAVLGGLLGNRQA